MRPFGCYLVLALLGTSAHATEGGSLHVAARRLTARLSSLPDKWPDLGPPLCPISGRSPESIVNAGTSQQLRAAMDLLVRLATASAAERPGLLDDADQRRPWTEYDLWVPAPIIDEFKLSEPETAMLMTDAWLEVALRQRRKDVLMLAASYGFQLARRSVPPTQLLAPATAWAELPVVPTQRRWAAQLVRERAEVLYLLGRNREAVKAFEQAGAAFIKVGDSLGRGRAVLGAAKAQFRLGHNQEALQGHRLARTLFQTKRDLVGVAHTWLEEADVLFFLGQNDPSRRACHVARQLYVEQGSKLGEGNTWLHEAVVLLRIGQTEAALDANRKARQLFQQIPDRLGEANTWQQEGKVLFQLSRIEEAQTAHERARALSAEAGNSIGQANAWCGQGQIWAGLGQNDRALRAYRKARELFQEAGDQLGVGTAWVFEAEVLSFLGQGEESRQAYQTARARFLELEDLEGQGNTWLGEASLPQEKDGDRELQSYKEALRLFEQVQDMQGQGNAWRGLADALSQRGLYDRALAGYRQALRLFSQLHESLGLSVTWRGLARMQMQQRQWAQALEAAQRALRQAQAAESFFSELLARQALVKCHLAQRDPAAAVVQAEAALPLLQHLRHSGITEENRTLLTADLSLFYDLLVSHYAQPAEAPQRRQQAARLAEAAHAPVLLDLLSHPKVPAAAPSVEEERQTAAFQASLAGLDVQLAMSQSAAAQHLLRQQRQSLEHQLYQIRFRKAVNAPIGIGEPLTDAARDGLINDSGPALMYYTTPEALIAIVFLPGHPAPAIYRLPASRAELAALSQELRGRLANPRLEAQPDTAEVLRAAYRLLIAPMAEALQPYEGKHLTLIPHGPLHQLPFDALLGPDGRPLYMRWMMSLAPSLSALYQLRQRERSAARTPLVVLAAGSGVEVPTAQVQQLRAFYAPHASVAVSSARYRDYLELAPQARHLLLNTHGYHVQNDREETYLELAPSSDGSHDSRLRASEIATIPLAAELVVLAACETARGEALLSDERLDLSRAFLTAGARAVLATRWQLPAGAATQQLLLELHRLLTQGQAGLSLPLDQALAMVREAARTRGAPAAVWAAFVLIGDAAPPLGRVSP